MLAFSGVVLAQQSTPRDAQGQPSRQGADRAPYIIVFKDNVGDPAAVAEEHRGQHGAQPKHVYGSALRGYSATLPSRAVEAIQRDPRVAFVDEDLPQEAFAQQAPTGVRRIGASSDATKQTLSNKGTNVGVAVIDSGIDLTHPDLPNVVNGKNAIGEGGTTTCADPDSTTTSADDDNGHGTHVAGTIGAKDDENGVVGVAPGTKLYAVKVLNNEGKGYRSDVICGIDWVTANAQTLGIKIANMSLGGSGSDDGETGIPCADTTDAYRKAICKSTTPRDDDNDQVIDYPGVAYVVAAGNSGTNLKGQVPAAYNEALTVTNVADFDGKPGALYKSWTCTSDRDDTARDSSNYTTKGHSDEAHTIAAPGTCIRSTYKDGGYATTSGTSMASPHIAGVAALCLAAPSTATNGTCAGLAPTKMIVKLRDDAKKQASSYGFKEDPHRVTSTGSKYYGYLTYANYY
jgi:subtilisin